MSTNEIAAKAEVELRMITIQVMPEFGYGDGKLHAEKMTNEGLQDFANDMKDNYLVPVSKDAPCVCIDGRPCACTVAGTEPVVGPKVAGGAEQTAFAAAELTPFYYGDTIADDARDRAVEVGTLLAAKGIVIGGHTTTGARENGYKDPSTGAEQTGCGAAEKHVLATERIADVDETIFEMTNQILGLQKRPDSHVVAASEMKKRNTSYGPKMMLDIEIAQDDGKSTEVLEGPHGECAIVLNWVDGTTIDRDAMQRETGKEVFVIDVWYLEKLADAMSEGRPDATEMRTKLLYNMTAFQLGVYAELGDGSHPVIVYTEEEPEA